MSKFKNFSKNVKLRIICGFFDHIATMSVMPFMVLYLADELGKVTSGVILSLNVVFSLFCNLIGGYYADRFSRKGLLITGQCLFLVIYILMTIFIHPDINMAWAVVSLFVFATIAGSMVFPALEALIIDSTTEQDRKDVYVFTYWTNNLAIAIGTALGGLFYKDHRVLLFSIVCLIMFITTTVFYKYLVDPTVHKEKIIVETHWVHDLLMSYKTAMQDTKFVFYTAASIFIFSAEMALTNYVGVRLHEVFKPIDLFGFHIDGVRMMSLLLIENTILVVSIAFLVNRLAEPFKQEMILLVGAFLYVAGYAATHHATLWWILMIATFIATVGELMYSPIYSVFQAKLMPEDKRASYIAFGSLGFSMAGLVASSGLIIGAYTGSFFMMWLVLFMGIIGIILLLLALRSKARVL